MGIHNTTIRSLLGLCLISLLMCGCNEGESVVFEQAQSEQILPKEEETFIFVHVCGAVNHPGVMKLPEGSRVWDCLEMAGGFTSEADEEAVNLAAFAKDGQKLYFPTVQESLQKGEAGDQRVDLNLADEKALTSLPGIGSAKAQAILRYREEHGDFTKTEELLEVPGIKQALFDQLRELVKVSGEG